MQKDPPIAGVFNWFLRQSAEVLTKDRFALGLLVVLARANKLIHKYVK